MTACTDQARQPITPDVNGKLMAIISRTDDAEAILQQDVSFMLRMDKAFNCWIQVGRLNSKNQLVADGERIAQVTTEVFDALIPSMDQVFCSEYFQVLDEDGRRASDNGGVE
ncbi:hypothetical protein [Achromobacter aegrifaciens]|nr:hypothetical protein [Achromobacter aegrifaciens]